MSRVAGTQGSQNVAVVGVGTTDYGNFPDQSPYDLGATALTTALRDSGLRLSDIDGLVTHRLPDYQRFAELLGMDPRFALGIAGQGRMSATAIAIGAMAIRSGAARHGALVYGNNGRSAGDRYGGATDRYGSGGPGPWFPYGMTSPGAVHAMMFQRHMALYGTTQEQLAAIPIAFRKHAQLNPQAVMRKPIDMEAYLGARFIAEPLRLLDYCLINDGGIAMILTSAERAADLPKPPVHLRGIAQDSALAGSTFPPEDFWRAPLQRVQAASLGQAGIARADVDGLMVYDNFSPTVLFSLEGLGYCGVGESGAWIQGGRIELGGECPLNTNGGHLSESYMQGWALNVEAIRQLRGEAGARQIDDARHVQYVCASPVVSSIIYGRELG